MKLQFRHAKERLTEKYNGKDDPRDHLEKQTKAWGTDPQLEWVHIFCHTLDTIPLNWYLEIELHHGNVEWDVLKEGLLLTFSFEDGFASIDESLQQIKEIIFRTPKEPMEWTQLDWRTHLHHALECR